MTARYVGIDPGLRGAIAVVDGDAQLIALIDTPVTAKRVDAPAIAAFLVSHEPLRFVALEAQHAMPAQGATSGFRLGETYGLLRGILATLGTPSLEVRAAAWQKHILAGQSGGDSKTRSMRFAAARWPDAVLATPRGRQLDGRADALCLALYARDRGANAQGPA